MVKKVVLVAVAALIAWMMLGGRADIDGASARQLVASGAVLLDVRSPGEFAAGHIDGAINVPLDRLPGQLAQLGARERPVVVYCRSGSRSARAAGILRGAGFQAVHDLGGMGRW